MAVDIIARGMAGEAGEQAEIAQRFVVSPYDPTQTYNLNDIVSYDGKLYLCTGTNVTGTFDPSKWSQIVISSELTEIINKLATITNPMLIKGRVDTVDELPADAEPGWVYFVGTDEETNLAEYVYTEDEEWQYIGTAHVEVDDALSTTSTNPVQNKVVTNALNEKYPIAWDVTVTQAQYDALPESKNYDGKHYHISDGGVAPQEIVVYGWHVNPNESDPEAAITYLKDAVGMEPASMGVSTFDYGTWGNAFFMPKPCMVKYDGTVDYYLDPDDYTKKLDGTASDVADIRYRGNAMMEWPLIWWKYESGTAEGEGYFYVSNRKVDDSYQCWSNINSQNKVVEHFYTAIYNGTTAPKYSATKTYDIGDYVTYSDAEYKCITTISTAEAWDSSKWEKTHNVTPLRSISGIQLISSNGSGFNTGDTEVSRAAANDTTANSEWYIDTWSDRMLINGLLILISKSLNSQPKFGQGISKGNQTAKEAYVTGALNDKGMFYGDITGTATAVKVFGMENWYSLAWRRTAGMIGMANGTIKVKMTYNTADGSTATSYNSSGDGYIDLTNITGIRPTSDYVKFCKYSPYGYVPIVTGITASSTQYYCDYFYTDNSALTYLNVGGYAGASTNNGFSFFQLRSVFSTSSWSVTASLSLKPLAVS